MFYSQFILAKKGPLGTIWIAAHLERKLRKNQVADTDIGVSVDSILSTDVPIALRLSSHLLLGVVRIYSRKVNYLFDDCSEALLKIKQAFRSTAVDLPPEESTAPYHSITLPETFDLDDFELPDNEFQGNYVDHHVSARDQITLQDTMEGVVYSTSQFGLDERFGDGDTSQIGFDLDEDIFLDKVAAQTNDGIPDDDLQVSAPPMTPEEKEEMREDIEGLPGTTEIMDLDGAGDQIEVPDANIEAFDHAAEDPSTPGFMEHPSPSKAEEPMNFDGHMESKDLNFDGHMESKDLNFDGHMASKDLNFEGHLESKDHDFTTFEGPEDTENAVSKCDAHETIAPLENGCLSSDVEMQQANLQLHLASIPVTTENSHLASIPVTTENSHLSSIPVTTENISADNGVSAPSAVVEHDKPIPLAPECSNGNNSAVGGPIRVEEIHNGVVIDERTRHTGTNVQFPQSPGARLDETVASPSCSQVTTELEDPGRQTLSIDVETHNMGESCSLNNALLTNVVCPPESPGRPEVVNVEGQTSQEPKETNTLSHFTHDFMASNNYPGLHACTQKGPDMSSFGGNESHSIDLMRQETGNNFTLSHFTHDFMASNNFPGLRGCTQKEPDMSYFGGDQSHSIDHMGRDTVNKHLPEPALCEETPVDRRQLNLEMHNVASRDIQLENFNRSAASDLPAPERLLFVSEGLFSKPNDLFMESTPRVDEFGGGFRNAPVDRRQLDLEMHNVASRDIQLENFNRSAASDLPAPERLLFVSEGHFSKPNDLFMESTPRVDEIGGGIKLTAGQKRSFTESTLTVHSLNSSDSFNMTKFMRTAESVPDDNDLLSSILVGRKSSVLKMKPTPPVPEKKPKRPRSTPRASAKKRKVLMDDMMVLHGDIIRQQLTSTEDIRRLRKKAPCTSQEISLIQRQFLEEEIFNQPSFTGMSTALIFLHHEKFDLTGLRVYENDPYNGPVEPAKDVVEPSVLVQRNLETQTVNIPIQSEIQHTAVLVQSDFETQTVNIPIQSEIQHTGNSDFRSQHEKMGLGVQNSEVVADAANHSINRIESSIQIKLNSIDIANNMTENTVQADLVDKSNDVDASVLMEASCMYPQRFETEPIEETSLADTSNGRLDAIECSVDPEKDNGNLHASLDVASVESEGYDINMLPGSGDQAVEVHENIDLSVMNPDEVQAPEEGCEGKDLASSCMQADGANLDLTLPLEPNVDEENASCMQADGANLDLTLPLEPNVDVENASCMQADGANLDSTLPLEPIVDVENAPLNEEENTDVKESDLPSALNEEATTAEDSAVELRDDYEEDVLYDNDTEFLNVDDDDVEEDYDDDNLPGAEDPRLLENSGWSSRTRAVAKYLQTLFDKESVPGKRVLPMDNLLMGKTRKEASRMFFETLVLKTKDYIDVEQAMPFDNINVKPRIKLMKSDF
ncbi:hypothetical protein F8388_025701 [Cannabis sativa]|uniref:Sister chromatid cohesion 1 protein 4 n=1 Tax=Cannabis sativa TaxID=3483 RepID=A0A7J6G428_CANSA|nr:hypothetical protein G4B88_004518 [Cannabis sativa]KAF4376830.1 hypothetical protein F8388_025701 [Cannabis sativa]